jgi:hypothetical protein
MVDQTISDYHNYGIKQNLVSDAGTVFRQDMKPNNRLLKGIQYNGIKKTKKRKNECGCKVGQRKSEIKIFKLPTGQTPSDVSRHRHPISKKYCLQNDKTDVR